MVKKIALALVAFVAVLTALWLLFGAAFPYFYAESGQAAYIREHRPETIAEVLGAAALFLIAWLCIRRSFSGRAWLAVASVLVVAAVAGGILSHFRAPEGVKRVGGNWYVTIEHTPREIDTVLYAVYYRRYGHYQSIHDLVSEYHFVPPDCFTFRGLKVSDRPMYAMCGFRSPAGSYDTTLSEAALLAQARTQPAFREDWESIVQQQDFARRVH